MSQLIEDLATIEVSNEVLKKIDAGNICQSFRKNYRKLDDLKNFRTEYEKKSWLMAWWDNDKLRDAQLDSAEVQAEFSKTIGQLMMISIMQSKKLAEQQTQLNEQQGKLKTQANGIAEQAGELQKQHQVLAEQSEKLETLVREYFELKGLTEDGAQKLIEIAKEIKTTKESMLQEFAVRSKEVEATCGKMASQVETLSVQVNDQIRLAAEQTRSGVAMIKQETRQALLVKCNELDTNFSTKLAEQGAAHQEKLRSIQDGLDAQSVRIVEMVNELSGQKTHQEELAQFQQRISCRIKYLSLIVVCTAFVVLVILGGMARLLKWI